MSVASCSREFISSLVSFREFHEGTWRRRGFCASSQVSLSRGWVEGADGRLRLRRHGLRASRILGSRGAQRKRGILRGRLSDSEATEDAAENGSLGEPESGGGLGDDPSEAAFRRGDDAVPSTSANPVSDGCIADFLPLSEQKRQGSDLPTLLRRFWKVAAPYWSSDDKVKARFWLAGVFALTLATTGISVGFNFLGRDFYNALASKDQEQFYNQLIKYFAAFIGGIPVFVLRDYFRDTLALRWRGWMTTQYLDKYFENRTFYNIQSQSMIDNPDQRIVDDLNNFSGSALGFALALFNATINLISFSGILYGIYPPLFFVLLVYSIGGTAISVLLGKNLVGLNFMQEKKEADFRYGLVRVRENAESIAFYGGEASEIQLLLQRFKQSFDNYTQLLIASRNLDFFTSFYRYLIQLLPAAVVAPLYFAGKIEFGVINQSFSAFNNVLSDFSIIVYQFQSLSAFSAVVDRLGKFSRQNFLPSCFGDNSFLCTPCLNVFWLFDLALWLSNTCDKNNSGEFTDILDEQNALSQVAFQNGGLPTDQLEPDGIVASLTLASTAKSRISLVDVEVSSSASHPLLALENVTLYTPQYSMSLFKELSLVVNKGENLLVIISISSPF
ncbi:hypothetical protein KC19_9G062500 [Ceratodon purpureus]|uniref:ABC transmembrane type-1 domain-containing protein n=1 Tax=Ceratodon purpureus TaxID=3225 RepID=A0A8T0GP87_CERPU|nr:hypothetical protein KC19_9G062500 [Ceratodon purpureus]